MAESHCHLYKYIPKPLPILDVQVLLDTFDDVVVVLWGAEVRTFMWRSILRSDWSLSVSDCDLIYCGKESGLYALKSRFYLAGILNPGSHHGKRDFPEGGLRKFPNREIPNCLIRKSRNKFFFKSSDNIPLT